MSSIPHIISGLSLLGATLSLIGCGARAHNTTGDAARVTQATPVTAHTLAEGDDQRALVALQLEGDELTHKRLRLNPQVELLLVERVREGAALAHDDEVTAEQIREVWLIQRQGDVFTTLTYVISGQCEDYTVTLEAVASIEALSLFTVGCANGADYWSSREDITLLYHGHNKRSPVNIWAQTINHSNEMDQCSHQTALLIRRERDTITIKTMPQAFWSKSPEEPDISELTKESCEAGLEPTKTYEIKLAP